MFYKLIGRDQRLRVRDMAREIYLECDCDGDRACRTIRHRQAQFKSIVGTILVRIAISLAIALVKHWIEQKFSAVPSDDFVAGEPGA